MNRFEITNFLYWFSMKLSKSSKEDAANYSAASAGFQIGYRGRKSISSESFLSVLAFYILGRLKPFILIFFVLILLAVPFLAGINNISLYLFDIPLISRLTTPDIKIEAFGMGNAGRLVVGLLMLAFSLLVPRIIVCFAIWAFYRDYDFHQVIDEENFEIDVLNFKATQFLRSSISSLCFVIAMFGFTYFRVDPSNKLIAIAVCIISTLFGGWLYLVGLKEKRKHRIQT